MNQAHARSLPLVLRAYRSFLGLATIASLALLLTACGGGDGSGSGSTVTTPSITTQPTSQSVSAGSSVTFTVVASGGGTLAYQWYKGGTAVSGATAASYTISTAATSDAGSYYVTVSNSAGSATSNTVTLTVTAAGPTISTQPTSQTVAVGASVTFTVVATGSGTLTYQWYKGSTAISGATSASYTIATAATSDADSYYVTVTDTTGTTTSSTVTLTVGSTTACDSSYVSGVMSAITTLDTALGSTLTADMTYSSSTYTTAQLNVYKTNWSNLPPGAISFSRPGITLSQLTSATQISAFNALAQTALSTAGYEDFQGVLAADDYLGYTENASGYGADLYHVAVVGTPSASGAWSLMFGGHHMAFNLAFNGGCVYPTPHHIGVEPRTSFTSNNHYASTYGTAVYTSGTYQVLASKASATVAIFTSLDSSTLSSAFLTGQTFSDMLIGPVEADTGSYSAVTTKFDAIASSSDRGVLVSSLSSSQQALVTAAIEEFTNDYDSTTAANLLAAYESGYSSTYVAWANAAGTFSSSGPDITTSGTYMRIDGPRVWIELAIQAGIVIQGQTHYHMMFRDKTYDYYDQLAD